MFHLYSSIYLPKMKISRYTKHHPQNLILTVNLQQLIFKMVDGRFIYLGCITLHFGQQISSNSRVSCNSVACKIHRYPNYLDLPIFLNIVWSIGHYTSPYHVFCNCLSHWVIAKRAYWVSHVEAKASGGIVGTKALAE